MVVIEPVATGEETTNEKVPKREPVRNRSFSSTTLNVEEDSQQGGDNTVGCTSNGFETAIETELNDDNDARKEDGGSIEKCNNNKGDDMKATVEASSKDKEGQQQLKDQNLFNGKKNDESREISE